ARDERHGGAAVEQVHRRAHLLGLGGDVLGNALFDAEHGYDGILMRFVSGDDTKHGRDCRSCGHGCERGCWTAVCPEPRPANPVTMRGKGRGQMIKMIRTLAMLGALVSLAGCQSSL